jgi:hypothetical protein
MNMNDNDISIWDWLKRLIKNPKLWLMKSPKGDAEEQSSKSDIRAAESVKQPGNNIPLQQSIPSESASDVDQVQVDISLIIPSGSSINLAVATGVENNKLQGKVEASPKLEKLWFDVYPSSGERISKDADKGTKAGSALGVSNFKISISLVTVLVILSLFLYTFSRFAGLNRFPAYFFSDEAMQTIFAEKLIDNNFLAANDKNIPIYVAVEGDRWSPMASIYIQATSVLLFGKSVLQTRATSIFIGLLGVVAIGLILKFIFKQRYWWVAILFLTLLPAWFLHSRTAFETVMATAFFAIFLLFYLLYRYRNPYFFFGAVAFGALAFYSYSNSQALMGLVAIGLAISDFNYHKNNRRILLWSIPLVLFVSIPFILFQLKVPDGISAHLRAINSYWFQPIPLSGKLLTFLKNYLIGLSPNYWFIENSRDLIRHRMVGYGHFPLWSLPLIITGIVLAIKNFRESSYRAIVISILAAPVGGSMLEISIARTLAFIVPASILAILGLEWLLGWVERKIRPAFIAVTLFVVLATISIFTLNDAVNNGPLWTDSYGLYGLQYGAVQIFEETLPDYLKDGSTARIIVTPVWANATDRFVEFFFSSKEDRKRISIEGLDTYLLRKQDISPNDLFIWTADEYKKAVDSGKFKFINVEKIIPYPNGEPGFFGVRMQYADNIDEILAAEKEARNQPMEEDIELDGKPVHVTYSRIDGGELKNIFDKDANTLMRGLEANPFTVQLDFAEPREINSVDLTTATMNDFTVTIKAYGESDDSPVVYENNYKDLPSDPTITITLDDGPQPVSKLIIEILHHTLEDPTNIHIRELQLR